MTSIGVKGFKFSLGTFLSLWISLVAAETICTEVTEIPEDECNALVALEAVDETFSLGWKSPCSSSDITCEDGHVIEIRVGKLEGALPDLSALSFLRAINRVCEEKDYYEEEFYYCSSDSYYLYEDEECYDFGNLTALSDLSTLTHLTFLNLENNSLNGTLDVSLLPSSLQSLNLGFNDLEGPLPNLSNKLPNLTYIDLSGNALDINGGHFPNSLESLQLGYADLKQLPDLSSLTHLTTLDITGNELSEPIVGTSLPNSLMELYLNDTLFNQPLPDLGHLTHLTTLDISNNTISEPIVGAQLPSSLTKLYLNNLVLNQKFPDLSALNNITTLKLNDAKLTGPIIAADLPSNLTTLSLRNNPLNQSLPDLSALTQLTDLDLGNTQLSGSINPAFLPPSLEVLKLDNNALAGDIPDLSKLEALVSLNLENNPQLTWSDKTSLLPPSLESLYLNGTSLKQLPDFSNLDKLIYLELKNAQLSGVIDTHYFPTQLKWLYLSDNQLQDSLPDLSQLTELQGFFVFNKFYHKYVLGELPGGGLTAWPA